MSCMRCGKKTDLDNVFCPECLSGMEGYPVKPGTAIHIPIRREPVEQLPARQVKEKSPEEQLASLRKLVKALVICLVSLAAALAISIGMLTFALAEETQPEADPQITPSRRNYTTSAPQNEE